MKNDKLKALSDKGIDLTDAAIRGFTSGLEDVASGWRRELIDLISRQRPGDLSRLADIRYVANQVQGQLNRLGYEDLVRKLLSNYGESLDRATEVLDALGVKPERLSKLDSKAFRALRQNDYSYLVDVGTEAVRQIAHGVVQNAIAGQPRSQMIEAVERVLDKRFKVNAAAYADTALVSYDRRVNWDMWVAAGVTRFLYRGPKDIKNRPFCKLHVGKVFSIEEVDKLDNHVGPMPVKYFGGGWNCRHVWSPAVESL